MFSQGLKHGAYVIVATIAALALTPFLNNKTISILIVGVVVIASWLIVGYFFKKRNGSIFTIIKETKKIKGLWHYILGAGLIWGPAKLIFSEFPVPDINPVINIILLLISIPMAGMTIIGALVIGGIFYREKA